jgi:hypothetical protein
MEVHHHSHHPKKWKEYVQEFLMLFFAVFLGFMAEYYLEYRAERHKEHDYLTSMVVDLKTDLAEMKARDSGMVQLKNAGNKLVKEIYKPTWESTDIDSIYIHSIKIVTQFVQVRFSSGTADQLRNAGGYRLIQNDEIVRKISDYEKGKVEMERQLASIMVHWADIHRMQDKILHLNVFPGLDKKGDVIYDRKFLTQIESQTGNAFLSKDKNTFYEYSNYVNVVFGYVSFYKLMSERQQVKAVELIKLIENQE